MILVLTWVSSTSWKYCSVQSVCLGKARPRVQSRGEREREPERERKRRGILEHIKYEKEGREKRDEFFFPHLKSGHLKLYPFKRRHLCVVYSVCHAPPQYLAVWDNTSRKSITHHFFYPMKQFKIQRANKKMMSDII